MNEVSISEIPVEMLERLAIRCDDYAYFSRDSFDGDWAPLGMEPPHPDVARVMADVLPRLVLAFEMTYSPRLWRLAGEFCNYLVFHSGLLDPTGVPDWKRAPTKQDLLDLIDCLGAVARLGGLGHHRPWSDWALRGIQHRLLTADNEAGWPRILPTGSFEKASHDHGAHEALTFLNATPYDASLWDAVATRYFNPPQLVLPNLPVDPFRARLNKEVYTQAILKQDREHIQINLWLSHEDEWMRIESGMPEEGWLLIEAPISTQVSIRIPEWLALNTIRINDSSISEVLLKLQPGFIDLPILTRVTEQNRWKITFALPSRSREFHAPPACYEAVWRGSYLLRLIAEGKSAAIFERPRLAKQPVSRSVAEKVSETLLQKMRKAATSTARLTVVSITEAPLFSTQELLLYLAKCVANAGLEHLPETVTRTATDVERMFGGRWPGLTPCTLPYHDLKHTWIVTASLADLLCGMHMGGVAIGPRHFELGLIAMLLHGTGALSPTANTRRHYELSAEFSATYLPRFGTAFPPEAQELVRTLILCTGYDAQVDVPQRLNGSWQQVAYAMGSAKLLGQMASADYLDRMPELFDELASAQAKDSMGEDQPRSVQDLPSYFRNFVVKSLEERYGMVYMYYKFLSADQRNPYVESAEKHLRRVEKAKTKKNPG